jgi:hypothetical protein
MGPTVTRLMYDSTSPTDIPTSAEMVAGYVDGLYTWSAADWARFPQAIKVRIAVFSATNDGVVGDVESGDMTPISVVSWVLMRRAAGVDPTVYVNDTNRPTVEAAFAQAGVPQPHYWLAQYDGVNSLPPGCVAKQFINPPGSGGHYDLSTVADYWPGVDPPAAEEDGMQSFFIKVGDPVLWIPGPNQVTQFNLVADKGAVDVQLYASDVAGNPVALDPNKSGFQLQGNLPNVHGPVQVFGSLADLGVSGPVTLGIQATQDPTCFADAVVTLSLH